MSKSNGHDKKNSGKSDDKESVIKFPTMAERDRIRKKQSYPPKAQRLASEPFFNFGSVPPFARFITIALILSHAVFVLFLGNIEHFKAMSNFGFVPGVFTGNAEYNWWSPLTPVTFIFIHADWTHVLFNALMGLALCTFVERMFSTPTTVKFFFLCALGGAAVYFGLNPQATAPVIGASAATSGLFAAALMMLYEQGRFGALTGKFAGKGPWPIIGVWAIIMVLLGLFSGGIAWEAHIGGFLTGSALYTLMRKGKLRL